MLPESTRSSRFHQEATRRTLAPTSRTTQASLPSRRITQSPKANHNAAVASAIKGKRISSKLTPLPNIRESEFLTPEENPIHNANIVTKTPIPTQLQHLSKSNSPTALSKHHIRGFRTNLVLKPLGAHEEKTARAKALAVFSYDRRQFRNYFGSTRNQPEKLFATPIQPNSMQRVLQRIMRAGQRPARHSPDRTLRRWLCPYRSTCTRPDGRRTPRRPPAWRAPRTAHTARSCAHR